ncbi:branched-chain amino acid aminotransferase [Canibacter sp. lx-72]|uniref:branched-chain amino acid aminotransferase n=1 Tax=Canibacter zhuwentaonis TaxID=2837491 RepID=UPI001BDD22AD|nr:branched-chain amino acid aminotransferase [Canibacter zhuwentaonis]
MQPQFDIQLSDSVTAQRREKALQNPGFGVHFTDHMAVVEWDSEQGWHNAAVTPYAPLQMDPAAAVLHYAQEIFEGMKAYRQPDGGIALFRPGKNAVRFNRSAKRLALPEIPEELFLEACRQLVRADEAWVPETAYHSLYLRPFMIADEVFLGVRAAQRARFIVIACPAGDYFPGGVKPLDLWLSTKMTRAAAGGTGFAKCGGNYAGSLAATTEAYENGCQQVLFTDAYDRDSIDELGGMNLFLVTDDNKLITPEVNGNILEGVTRDSIIQLAKNLGYEVAERRVTISEWREGAATGAIREAFACGTAAVVAPIGRLLVKDAPEIKLPEPTGTITMQLREELMGIQHGTISDTNGWLERIS